MICNLAPGQIRAKMKSKMKLKMKSEKNPIIENCRLMYMLDVPEHASKPFEVSFRAR
jgi:hypothetical protein